MIYMKSGPYIVGDPCYFFTDKGHDEWSDFLDKNGFLNGEGKGMLVGSETEVCVFSTAYGDGSYFDLEGREYAVDSGMIGIIEYRGGDVPNGSHLVEFEDDFECYSDGGILFFGDLSINTDETPTYDDIIEEEGDEEDDEDYEKEIDQDEY